MPYYEQYCTWLEITDDIDIVMYYSTIYPRMPFQGVSKQDEGVKQHVSDFSIVTPFARAILIFNPSIEFHSINQSINHEKHK